MLKFQPKVFAKIVISFISFDEDLIANLHQMHLIKIFFEMHFELELKLQQKKITDLILIAL